jgi:RNA ligase
MIDLNKLQEAVSKGEVNRRKHDTLPLSIYTYSKTTEIDKNWNEITRVCRGLILHDTTGRVVGNPFPKFFNIEEQAEDKRLAGNRIIKFKGTDIQLPDCDYVTFDKMDGSIIYVTKYYDYASMIDGDNSHAEHLIVASKGSFNSAQAIKARDLLNKKYPNAYFTEGYTYIFEIIYRTNRIVVDYGDREELILLGIRNNNADRDVLFSECDEFAAKYGFSRPTKYEKQIEDLLLEKDSPFDNREGYVIHFHNGEKLKIKFTAYFDLHKIMTNVTTKDILDALPNGTSIAEFCATKDIPDEMLKEIVAVEESFKEAFTIIEMESAELYKEASNGVGILDINGAKEVALQINYRGKTGVHKAVAFAMMRNHEYKDIIWKSLKEKEKENRQFIGRAGEATTGV